VLVYTLYDSPRRRETEETVFFDVRCLKILLNHDQFQVFIVILTAHCYA